MAEAKEMEVDQSSARKPDSNESSFAPRFEIKRWSAVAMWSWDICADTCAICRNSLNEPSIEYQANPSPNNENGLSIAFGCCGHVFHSDCIQRWLKTRSVCPLCNKVADFMKNLNFPGSTTVEDFAIYIQQQNPNTVGIVMVASAVAVATAVTGTCMARRSLKRYKNSSRSLSALKRNKAQQKQATSDSAKAQVSGAKTKGTASISLPARSKVESAKVTAKQSDATVARIREERSTPKSISESSDKKGNGAKAEVIEASNALTSQVTLEKGPTQENSSDQLSGNITEESETKASSKSTRKKNRKEKAKKFENGHSSSHSNPSSAAQSTQETDIIANDFAFAVALAAKEAKSPSLTPVISPKVINAPQKEIEWEVVSKRKPRKQKPSASQPAEVDETTSAQYVEINKSDTSKHAVAGESVAVQPESNAAASKSVAQDVTASGAAVADETDKIVAAQKEEEESS